MIVDVIRKKKDEIEQKISELKDEISEIEEEIERLEDKAELWDELIAETEAEGADKCCEAETPDVPESTEVSDNPICEEENECSIKILR